MAYINILIILVGMAFIIHPIVNGNEITGKLVKYEDESVTLNCGIQVGKTLIPKIGWTFNETLIVSIDPNQEGTLEVLKEQFSGRLSINPIEKGDLTIKSVKWKDAGIFHCFYLTNQGVAVEKNTYVLKINVIPKKVDAKCYSDEYHNVEVTCSDSEKDVHTIKFSVTSYPKATLKLLESPTCDNEYVDTRHCNIGTKDPITCVMELNKVCAGKYVLQAMYNDGVKQVTRSKTVDISETVSDPEPNIPMWIIIVPVFIGIILILVIFILFLCCKFSNACSQYKCRCSQEAKAHEESGIDRTDTSENIPLKEPKVSVESPKESGTNESDVIDNEKNQYLMSRQLMVEEAYRKGQQTMENTEDLQSIEMILRTRGGTKLTVGVEKANVRDDSKPNIKSEDSFDSISDAKAIDNVPTNV